MAAFSQGVLCAWQLLWMERFVTFMCRCAAGLASLPFCCCGDSQHRTLRLHEARHCGVAGRIDALHMQKWETFSVSQSDWRPVIDITVLHVLICDVRSYVQ
jgi:hypothetical protein